MYLIIKLYSVYVSVHVMSINVNSGIISLILFVHHHRSSPRST